MSKKRPLPHLPYCPELGVHHMNWESRHFKTSAEKRLRNTGAFILSVELAPPPVHTLLHRSLEAPPKPSYEDIQNMLGIAEEGGLYTVLNTIDNATIDHYRKQLFILAMNPDEAIGRLYRKQPVTAAEMRGY